MNRPPAPAPAQAVLDCREFRLPLGVRTLVMGVLNVTPDSFSDGGRCLDPGVAIARAREMVAEGADLIDIGGESSRPGAEPVPAEEELRRVLPVIERLVAPSASGGDALTVPISIDTTKAEVAEAAIKAGARLINDITALRGDPPSTAMAEVAARAGLPVILMHMHGTPRTMQRNPMYSDVIQEISAFFAERLKAAEQAGIRPDQIVLDPGIGFGKTAAHNLEILRRLAEFRTLGRPVMVGPSRKSFIGQMLNLPVEERMEGTAAAVTVSIMHGASLVRVHDVRAMVRVARLTDAILHGVL